MRALVYDGAKTIVDRRAAQPQPGAGEALLKICRAGIYNTDLELVAGTASFAAASAMNSWPKCRLAPTCDWAGAWSARSMSPTVSLTFAGLVDVESMIEKHFALDEGPTALAYAAQPGTLKVILNVAG